MEQISKRRFQIGDMVESLVTRENLKIGATYTVERIGTTRGSEEYGPMHYVVLKEIYSPAYTEDHFKLHISKRKQEDNLDIWERLAE